MNSSTLGLRRLLIVLCLCCGLRTRVLFNYPISTMLIRKLAAKAGAFCYDHGDMQGLGSNRP